MKCQRLFSNFCGLVFIFLGEFTADIVSCVEFNDDGEFLATGDKGGRVVIFSRDKEKDEVRGRKCNSLLFFEMFWGWKEIKWVY